MKLNSIKLNKKELMSTKLLCFDVGKTTGWCASDIRLDYDAYEFGEFKWKGKSDFYNKIKDLVDLYKPDMICVLHPYGKMVGMAQSRLIGIIEIIACKLDLCFFDYLTDCQMRTYVFGRCVAGPQPIISRMTSLTGSKKELTENEADACMLSMVVSKIIKNENDK